MEEARDKLRRALQADPDLELYLEDARGLRRVRDLPQRVYSSGQWMDREDFVADMITNQGFDVRDAYDAWRKHAMRSAAPPRPAPAAPAARPAEPAPAPAPAPNPAPTPAAVAPTPRAAPAPSSTAPSTTQDTAADAIDHALNSGADPDEIRRMIEERWRQLTEEEAQQGAEAP